MPVISKDEAERIATGIMYDMPGQPLNCSNAAVPVAVYPQSNSQGVKATQMIIRPGGAIYFRPMTTDRNGVVQEAVAGAPSAMLFAGTDYILPIHPQLNTLSFMSVDPVGTSLYVNWVIPG